MTLKHFQFPTILSVSPFFIVFLPINFVDIAKDPIVFQYLLLSFCLA